MLDFSLGAQSYHSACAHHQLLDQLQSDEFIQQQIQIGEYHAQKYTDPSFLDRVIDPDAVRKQEQQKANASLVFNGAQDLGWISLPVGVYWGDVLRIGHLGTSWALEWWLYKTLNHILISRYVALLSDTSEQANKSVASLIVTQEIFFIMMIYSLITTAVIHGYDYFHLEQIQLQQPPSLSSYLPNTQRFLVNDISPQGWLKKINKFFDYLGWMPSWTKRFECDVTKTFITSVIWLMYYNRWHIKSLIDKDLLVHADQYHEIQERLALLNAQEKLSDSEKSEREELYKILYFLVQQVIHVPFHRWVIQRTGAMTVLNSVANILVATPAWYRVGKYGFTMYRHITQENKSSQEELA